MKKQNRNTTVCRVNARLTISEANKLIRLTETKQTTVSNLMRELIRKAV